MVRSAWSLLSIALLVLAVGCQDRSANSANAGNAVAAAVAADPGTPAPVAAPARLVPEMPEPEPAPVAAVANATGPDAWLGRWTGPEGTSLLLEERDGAGYLVTLQSPDGRESFAGDAAGPNIVFERDDRTETLRAGSGKLTGLKGLADKSDCLVIQAGEGFCRD